MSTNSVFMKKEPQNFKIDYLSIIKTIPDNSYTELQHDKNNKVETRWRFFCIPSSNPSTSKDKTCVRKHVEISRKKPNFNREYLNKNMKWIETIVDPIFDQFVVKQYYYYSDQ